MHTSKDFAREIRARYNPPSDYAMAKLLGITRSAMSLHSSGGVKTFRDETGERIAELLDLDEAYVLACLAAERAKRPDVRHTWERVARAFARHGRKAARVAMLLISLVFATVTFTPGEAQATAGHVTLTDREIYITRSRRRRRRPAACRRRRHPLKPCRIRLSFGGLAG